jgi:hypothetical protein
MSGPEEWSTVPLCRRHHVWRDVCTSTWTDRFVHDPNEFHIQGSLISKI